MNPVRSPNRRFGSRLWRFTSNGVNKKISTPVAIIIILACAILVAGLAAWQF